MKYEKAQNILPRYIIELIQQYIDGGYLYIPTKPENKKAWGENSGIKESLKKRNKRFLIYTIKEYLLKSLHSDIILLSIVLEE